MRKKGRYAKLSDEQFIKMVKESISGSDFMRKIGYASSSSSLRKYVKNRCENLGISFPQNKYVPNTEQANKKHRISDKDFFVKGIERDNKGIRKRILQNGYIEYKCAICSQKPVWNNKSLVLQIDHINGDHLDNRLENIRFLCPNCHSQTDTFSGKNTRF